MAVAAEGSINLVKISTKKKLLLRLSFRARNKDLNEFLMWGKEIAVKTHLRPLQPTDQPKSLRYTHTNTHLHIYIYI